MIDETAAVSDENNGACRKPEAKLSTVYRHSVQEFDSFFPPEFAWIFKLVINIIHSFK